MRQGRGHQSLQRRDPFSLGPLRVVVSCAAFFSCVGIRILGVFFCRSACCPLPRQGGDLRGKTRRQRYFQNFQIV